MADQLSGYVHGQKRFLGDVAHELASPLARIQAGLGILQQRVATDTASYVADVEEDIEHMSSLVRELLTFSRSQVTRDTLQLSALALAPVLQSILAREQATAVVVQPGIAKLPSVLADRDCLDRALGNLVRNALRYAGSAGNIQIAGSLQGEWIHLAILDEGPGLPEAELENVFRAFYRPEFARLRETGGTGLGLAIVRDGIEACHGTVQLRNRHPHGLEAIVRLHVAS